MHEYHNRRHKTASTEQILGSIATAHCSLLSNEVGHRFSVARELADFQALGAIADIAIGDKRKAKLNMLGTPVQQGLHNSASGSDTTRQKTNISIPQLVWQFL
jgi:hypothetical protein